MIVELISIGDELLIGQTINTNVSWLGQQLADLGASIKFGSTIQDKREDLLDAFERAINRADVVVVTGGLGPTKDDITKRVVCEFFDTELVRNEQVLANVKNYFVKRNLPMLEVNYNQADVPEIAEALHNKNGTAPGIWIERENKIFISLPGVPYEMKGIFIGDVKDRLRSRIATKELYYRTIKTQGIGETYLAKRIADVEDEARSKGVDMAYLPSPGSVRLRFTGEDNETERSLIDSYIHTILKRVPEYAYGIDEVNLEGVIGELLLNGKQTVSTVESCTAGSVSASIGSVPGASRYLMGGIVSYSNEIKSKIVGVSSESLDKHGAVSEKVVSEMASGGKQILGTDYCIATSGVAGPDGGTEEKPVGTVWIAIAGPERVFAKRFLFEKDRERNIQRTVLTALNLLRCELLGIKVEKN